MTCRAILHSTGAECIPLLLVRKGEMTPRQCDHEFRGATGDCPTCKAQSDAADTQDGGSFAQAILLMRSRGFGVTYKRFGYGSDGGVEPWRVCHWGHPPGYWQDVPFRNCQNPDTDTHTVNLAVIREYYEKQFKPELGFSIKTEPRLRRPGDPPRPYSPDLAIYDRSGNRMVAVEYQRSHEAYEKFADRDALRRLEGWASVDWWFDDTQSAPNSRASTVYQKSQMHRTHLAALGVHHFRCWVDPDTLKLQAEYGRAGTIPPERKTRVHRRLEKADLSQCSTARLIRELEGQPEYAGVKDYVQPLRPRSGSSLEFLENVNYSIERQKRIATAIIQKQRRLAEQDRKEREYFARLEAERKAAQELAAAARIEREQRLAAERKIVSQVLKPHHQVQSERIEVQDWARTERLRLQKIEDAKWHPIEFTDPVTTSRYSVRFAVNLRVGDLIRSGPGKEPEVYRGISGAGYSTDRYTYSSIDGWQVRLKESIP